MFQKYTKKINESGQKNVIGGILNFYGWKYSILKLGMKIKHLLYFKHVSISFGKFWGISNIAGF